MPKTTAERYIVFKEREPLPKTRRWDVVNTRTNEVVGEIQWYGGFRKYVFFPEDDTLYDASCMQMIGDFLNAQQIARKPKKRVQ